jgi:hypothetical protein
MSIPILYGVGVKKVESYLIGLTLGETAALNPPIFKTF